MCCNPYLGDKAQSQQPADERLKWGESAEAGTLRVGAHVAPVWFFTVRGKGEPGIWALRVPWVTDPWFPCEPGREIGYG